MGAILILSGIYLLISLFIMIRLINYFIEKDMVDTAYFIPLFWLCFTLIGIGILVNIYS